MSLAEKLPGERPQSKRFGSILQEQLKTRVLISKWTRKVFRSAAQGQARAPSARTVRNAQPWSLP